MLDSLSAFQIAPTLWVVNGEGETPATAMALADEFTNIIGVGDAAQVIVFPLAFAGASFGVSDDVARAIGEI